MRSRATSRSVSDRVAVLEGIERPLIVLDRIGVGIHPARPIARRHQVARAPALVGAEGPVVAEGHQPFETLRVADALGLEGGADPAVQLGATRHEDVLVHDLLEEPMAEPVIGSRRHQIGAHERVERRVHRGGFR